MVTTFFSFSSKVSDIGEFAIFYVYWYVYAIRSNSIEKRSAMRAFIKRLILWRTRSKSQTPKFLLNSIFASNFTNFKQSYMGMGS